MLVTTMAKNSLYSVPFHSFWPHFCSSLDFLIVTEPYLKIPLMREIQRRLPPLIHNRECQDRIRKFISIGAMCISIRHGISKPPSTTGQTQ